VRGAGRYRHAAPPRGRDQPRRTRRRRTGPPREHALPDCTRRTPTSERPAEVRCFGSAPRGGGELRDQPRRAPQWTDGTSRPRRSRTSAQPAERYRITPLVASFGELAKRSCSAGGRCAARARAMCPSSTAAAVVACRAVPAPLGALPKHPDHRPARSDVGDTARAIWRSVFPWRSGASSAVVVAWSRHAAERMSIPVPRLTGRDPLRRRSTARTSGGACSHASCVGMLEAACRRAAQSGVPLGRRLKAGRSADRAVARAVHDEGLLAHSGGRPGCRRHRPGGVSPSRRCGRGP